MAITGTSGFVIIVTRSFHTPAEIDNGDPVRPTLTNSDRSTPESDARGAMVREVVPQSFAKRLTTLSAVISLRHAGNP
jgi:hypothetical protein